MPIKEKKKLRRKKKENISGAKIEQRLKSMERAEKLEDKVRYELDHPLSAGRPGSSRKH